jgi:DNA-binding response OmpR family regulator
MTTKERTGDVLVVDDEPAYTDLLAEWLRDDYDVRTATSGTDALEQLDDAVDVVLLDRRMPGLSGDEVLDRIRESDFECRVAMVTAVEPSLDIVDMRFDDYLVKPISREELHEVVENLLKRTTYAREIQTLFALTSKRAVLEERHPPTELSSSDEFQELLDRIDQKSAQLDGLLDELSHEEYRAVFQEL